MPILINGSIAATMDIGTVEYNLRNNPNCKAIFVGDIVGYEYMINLYHILVASPLVPDYLVMEADIEGTVPEFRYRYEQYLQSEAAIQYFATILTAMHMGKFILLFFPPEAKELKYPLELLNYISNTYGLTTAFPEYGIQYSYNYNYDDFNVNLMYRYSLIPPEDYLQYAVSINYTKVVIDMNLPIRINTSTDAIVRWVNAYRDNIVKAGKPLSKPFLMEVHDNDANNFGTKNA